MKLFEEFKLYESLWEEDNLKEKQLEIILKTNPAPDEYHTWIRDIDDILTYEEAVNDEDYSEGYSPDYTYEMIQQALKEKEITVYSSYHIKQGTFVTPSYMEACSYAGSKKAYSKKVKLSEVAWIDIGEGIYTGEV